MRITAFSMLFAMTLSSAQQAGQDTKKHAVKERDALAARRELSKGSIGIVNKNLYIVVKSTRNELIVTPTEETEQRWEGKDANQAEVAVVYEGKIWSSEDLPAQFDLSKAVIVSFEGNKIRFFDFQTMSGGYYDRIGSR